MYYNYLTIKKKNFGIALAVIDVILAVVLIAIGASKEFGGLIIGGIGFIFFAISQIFITIKAFKYGEKSMFKMKPENPLAENDAKKFNILTIMMIVTMLIGALCLLICFITIVAL